MSDVLKETAEGYSALPPGDDAENKARMLEQLEWLKAQIESGEIVCFLACGLHSNNDGWGLGGVPNGTNVELLHESLVKLHTVFHDGIEAAGVTEVADFNGDKFNAEDRQH